MPVITKPNQHFDATTYTGNNGTQSVVNAGSFQPDFVWVKNRTNAFTHLLYDSVRGVGTLKAISSSETTAEGGMSDNSTFGYLSALNSDGFTVVSGSTGNSYTNSSSNAYVGWQWKANGAAVTNTAGSISAQVSANPTAGFSIVTWTGNGVTAATVGHGLGAIPAMIICKERTGTDYWHVKHQSTASNTNLFLNQIFGSTSAASVGDGILGDLSSNTTFGFATAGSPGNVVAVNENGITNVAYCFAPVAGYSAFGSYTGNGSTDGPFVYLGFRPKFILHKPTSTTGQWMMFDTSRNTYNVLTNAELLANSSAAEGAGGWGTNMDILSNGFKFRGFDNTNFNYTGITYIYMAFAENPFKYANAR